MSDLVPSGREGCIVCDGNGYVPGTVDDRLAWALDGRLISPCPFCLQMDQTLHGTGFAYHGQRVDPATVKAP